jgi:transmembrane sensor
MQLLFRKYIDNQCSPEEVQTLLAHFNAGENEVLLRSLVQQQLEEEEESSEEAASQPDLKDVYNQIRQQIRQTPAPASIPLMQRTWFRVAAVLLVTIGAGILGWTIINRPKQVPVNIVKDNTAQPTGYTRSIVLPDGSKVILSAGSKLDYPEKFNTISREVTLSGQAYFDIVHEANSLPFVIHTGKVKTTVLGTAFTIRAFAPDRDVTVTVSRGKVKVENDQKLLAVLTADQQIVYNVGEASVKQQGVKATESLAWAKVDMVFEAAAFETITEHIGKRYGVEIRFANSHLAACPITAMFDGTETLEQVLTVLCTVRNASYQVQDDGAVLIDGKGCNE